MLFNSYIFILLFLPLCIAGYFLLNRIKPVVANVYLLGMSLWVYGYLNPSYIAIIVSSVIINYLFYLGIKKSDKKAGRKAMLIFSVVINLGILAWFKYMDFFIENINAVFKSDYALLKIALPLGISFFTFQQLSFVIDTYRGEVADYGFIDYACYVTFFPQLVAGPIVSHDEFIPQFQKEENRKVNFDNLTKGIYLFVLGLSKKVLIADIFGAAVDTGYGTVKTLSSTAALFIILGYTIQLYFDFSGYCDMALGIGKMFNIKLPNNFNSPYKSANISEFWDRWHMTLTRFFTKYVYIPLGGNRKGKVRTYVNIMTVFFLSGLWHGADWTFVFWGVCHGLLLVLYRIFKKQLDKIPRIIGTFFTFITVNILWVFFRAPGFNTAFRVFRRVFNGGFEMLPDTMTEAFNLPEINFIFMGKAGMYLPHILTLVMLLFSLGIIFFAKNNHETADDKPISIHKALPTGVLLAWCVLSLDSVSSFLYFNF